jgi:hypothetical protein
MGMLLNITTHKLLKKRQYINIQGPEGIGYQSLTKTKVLSKEEKNKREKKKQTRAHQYHRPSLLSVVSP